MQAEKALYCKGSDSSAKPLQNSQDSGSCEIIVYCAD